jgi:Domain of unknown function (DUF4263)
MKSLESVQFSAGQCQCELDSFEKLLKRRAVLKERKHIKRFFRRNRQLSLLLGLYAPPGPADVLADEFDIFGNYVADMVVGNSKVRAYCMVEFEEGGPKSIFAGRNGKTRAFSKLFNQGFSQLVDWFCSLDDQKKTDEFGERFGYGPCRFHGLLVIGRSSGLSDRKETNRLLWRRNNIVVNGHSVQCVTYDQLFDELHYFLTQRYPKPLPELQNQPKA